MSGIAWGFLIAIYITIPGDLAGSGSKEKYYALITIIPLIINMGIPELSDFFEISAPANVLSPIFSITIFLSVIPVLYATETLPQTKIRERKLREHVKRVGKIVQESKKTKEK